MGDVAGMFSSFSICLLEKYYVVVFCKAFTFGSVMVRYRYEEIYYYILISQLFTAFFKQILPVSSFFIAQQDQHQNNFEFMSSPRRVLSSVREHQEGIIVG